MFLVISNNFFLRDETLRYVANKGLQRCCHCSSLIARLLSLSAVCVCLISVLFGFRRSPHPCTHVIYSFVVIPMWCSIEFLFNFISLFFLDENVESVVN